MTHRFASAALLAALHAARATTSRAATPFATDAGTDPPCSVDPAIQAAKLIGPPGFDGALGITLAPGGMLFGTESLRPARQRRDTPLTTPRPRPTP